MTTTINIPGAVWYDYLDPNCTGMEAELGLAALESTKRKRGRGITITYLDVPPEVATELADYLADRAWMLLGQYDVPASERSAHHAALKVAAKIRNEDG